MGGRIEARLAELGIVLPAANKPIANYVPVVLTGSFAYISGQVSIAPDGRMITGTVGADVSVEQAVEAARYCGFSIIAQLKDALGDLDRVRRCVRLTGFVNAVPKFEQQPQVINGASDLMVEVFGDLGRHTRSSVGVASLPRNAAVEVDATFEIA